MSAYVMHQDTGPGSQHLERPRKVGFILIYKEAKLWHSLNIHMYKGCFGAHQLGQINT